LAVVIADIDGIGGSRDGDARERYDVKGEASMPVYTCTIRESTLSTDTKTALAREIGRIHSSINHVPSTYVNVVFHELSADSVYTDGVPSSPVLVNAWIRDGHPDAETTQLATEIGDAVSRVGGITADRVLVVIQSGPARFAVEGGRVLPEPGEERLWIARD
jgi:phenylpyruvate tautomerase PptA (4-oxalocrotonate tautomerase family)